MSSKSSYAYEKLLGAMHALALGSGDIRSRLETAFTSFHVLEPENFPVKLRKDWKWVIKQMTKCGPGLKLDGEVRTDPVHNTMRKIHNKTGVKIAEKISELFWKLDGGY